MTTFRRILTGAALAVMAAGLANADFIIAYTVTLPSTQTDLTNLQANLTPWCPGCAGLTVLSNAEPLGYGAPTATTGVSMDSMNAPSTIYTLQGYDILVKTSISGNFSITNAANSSSNASGTVNENSYTAIALNGILSPALTQITDPTNDLFYNGSVPGNGPNPQTASMTVSNLGPGQTQSTSFANVKDSADVGCDNFPDHSNARCAFYVEITNSLGLVESSSLLPFFISTATAISQTITGGNNTTAQNTNVLESITVTYDYTTSVTSGTPEPTTMALMGGALIGLGLLGKRLKKS